MALTVERLDATTFKVTVTQGTPTMHVVTVRPDYYQKLTGSRVAAETLVEKSFEFLLAREPNTSILRAFDLAAIQQYFPDYETTMPRFGSREDGMRTGSPEMS